MRIYIGTKSPLKLPAVIEILDEYKSNNLLYHFDVESMDVESGVNLAPTDKSTYKGAFNRAKKLFDVNKNKGDLFVSIETGIINKLSRKFDQCICVILTNTGKEYIGISSELAIPKKYYPYLKKDWKDMEFIIKKAEELNISYKDTLGIYTNGLINRKQSIKEAFRNAFISYNI